MKGGVTEKLSEELSRTESRILGALSKLDEFLLDTQILTLSGPVPGTSQNTNVENQEQAGDGSQNDPLPEVDLFLCQSRNSNDSDPEEGSHNEFNFLGKICQ